MIPKSYEYEERVMRRLHDPQSRLLRIDQHSRHVTTYVLKSPLRDEPVAAIHKITVKTMNQMEVLNSENPPCFACLDLKKKIRGMLHS